MVGFLEKIFGTSSKSASVCLIGEVNTGKSTLANRIALVLMDCTKPPFDQVSLTLLGALEMNNTKAIIVANKVDLHDANPDLIQSTFPHIPVVPVSALNGFGMSSLYNEISQAS